MLDRATGEVIGGETLHRYRCLSVETVPYDLDRVGNVPIDVEIGGQALPTLSR